MSEMSFGAGAEARGRIGNVFLAFAEVKRATSEGPRPARDVSYRLRETSPAQFDLYFSRLLI